MTVHRWLSLACAALGAACVKPAKNPEAFRKLASSKSIFMAVENFEVDQAHMAIAKKLQDRADACLRVSVVTQSSGAYRSGPSTLKRDYNPTVTVDDQRVQFFVQIQLSGTNLIHVYDEAEGGDYVLVADAYPISAQRSRIDFYYASWGYDVLVNAVRGWIKDELNGCPDLAQ